MDNKCSREVCVEAVDMIVSFEKMHRVGADGRVYAYHDMVGYPTIGIGHLLSKVKYEDLSKYKSMTIAEAHELHVADLNKFATGVENLVTADISDNEFGALVSLAFNIGLGNLKTSTLLRKLNAGMSKAEVSAEFPKWNRAGGAEVRGLTRRRLAEKDLFLA